MNMPDLPTVVAGVVGNNNAVISAVNGAIQLRNGQVTDQSIPGSDFPGDGTVVYSGAAGSVSGATNDL